MICPYCGQEMEEGCLGTREGYGLFFAARPEELPSVFDTRKQIEAAGTVILDGPRHTRLRGSLDSSRAAVLLMTMQMGSFFLSVVLLILGLLVLLLVCLTTAGLVDDPSLAARGSWAWKVNLICTVAVLVLTVAAFALSVVRLDMEKLLGLSTAITLLSAVIQLAARVLYLRFLWQSARCLSAAGG